MNKQTIEEFTSKLVNKLRHKSSKATWEELQYMLSQDLTTFIESLKYHKPEVLEVGTKVEILENARNCGDYEEYWGPNDKLVIGSSNLKVISVHDSCKGIAYSVTREDGYVTQFPHYCVRPVEEEQTPEETLADKIKQLSPETIQKLQDILAEL